MSRIRRFGPLLVAILAGACDRTPPEPRVPTKIAVTPATSTLSETGSQKFVATLYDQNGKTLEAEGPITWQSDHPELVSMDATGLATAAASFLGVSPVPSVSISAEWGTLRGTATLTLSPLGTFDVWPDTNLVYAGTTRAITARLIIATGGYINAALPRLYEVLSGSEVQWTSSDNAVVTVDPSGVMTAVAPGHARIIAKRDTRLDTVEVYVAAPPATPLRFTSVASDAPIVGKRGAPGYVFAERGCGLSTDGVVYCWGATLDSTQISDRCEQQGPGGVQGTQLFRYRCSEIPLPLKTDVKFTAFVTSSPGFSGYGASGCGLATTRRVYCWGANRVGVLGIGTTDTTTHGVAPISGTDEFTEIHGWATSMCAIRTDGVLRCWGGSFGPSPVTVGSGMTWRALADASGCGLASDSTAYCFNATTVAQVGGTSRWKSIAAASAQDPCAMALDNSVHCGSSLQEQPTIADPIAGIGTYAITFLPDGGLSGVGPCGVTSTGDIRCALTGWSPINLPVKVRSFFGRCVIAVDDKVYCWRRSPTGSVTLVAIAGQ